MKSLQPRQLILCQPDVFTDGLGTALAAIILQLQAQGRVGPVLPEASVQLVKPPQMRFQAKRGPKPSHDGSSSVGL